MPPILGLVLAAQTHVIVAAGLGGEAVYEDRFAAHARALGEAARALAGDAARARVLSGKDATKDALRQGMAGLAAAAAPGDVLVAVFLGHGNLDGTEYKFNVTGPDPTCRDIAGWLDAVPARRQLVVLATSASGACRQTLQRAGRSVMTATRSGSERNATVFGRYFVEALRDPAADRDHDEATTAREAFAYADQKVRRYFTDEKRLATEHPVWAGDDAANVVLVRRGAAATAGGQAPPALVARRTALEDEVRAVKARKAELPREAYLGELERVLLELARVQESLDAAGGGQR